MDRRNVVLVFQPNTCPRRRKSKEPWAVPGPGSGTVHYEPRLYLFIRNTTQKHNTRSKTITYRDLVRPHLGQPMAAGDVHSISRAQFHLKLGRRQAAADFYLLKATGSFVCSDVQVFRVVAYFVTISIIYCGARSCHQSVVTINSLYRLCPSHEEQDEM